MYVGALPFFHMFFGHIPTRHLLPCWHFQPLRKVLVLGNHHPIPVENHKAILGLSENGVLYPTVPYTHWIII